MPPALCGISRINSACRRVPVLSKMCARCVRLRTQGDDQHAQRPAPAAARQMNTAAGRSPAMGGGVDATRDRLAQRAGLVGSPGMHSVLPACTMPCPVRSRRSHVQRRPDHLELRFRRRQRDVDGIERRAGRGRHRVCWQLLGGEFSHQFGHRRHRQDHRSRCRRRRQRPVRQRPGPTRVHDFALHEVCPRPR